MKFDYQQVRLQEDYVFGSVMSDPKLCLKLIRLILPQLEIDHIEMVARQKVVEDNYHSHGVRFDIYTRDDQQNVYNIEMQVQGVGALVKRARYYHGRIDSDNLPKNQDYRLLKPSYVIFICLFDPFGRGLHKYEFSQLCLPDHSLSLNIGQTTIFLNTKGVANDVNLGLVNFLDFLDNKEVDDEYVNEIKQKLTSALVNGNGGIND